MTSNAYSVGPTPTCNMTVSIGYSLDSVSAFSVILFVFVFYNLRRGALVRDLSTALYDRLL